MSEKCNCMWCKKNITAEEATEKRISFIHQVFQLAFIRTMFEAEPDRDISGVLEEMKTAIIEFFKDQEQHIDDLYENIFNIVFYYSKDDIGELFKPWEFKEFTDQIYDCVYRSFEFLKSDIGVQETPVLSGLITPQMIVDYQLKNIPFSKEIENIYMNKSQNVMSDMLSGLEERFGIQVEIPERPNHTVH